MIKLLKHIGQYFFMIKKVFSIPEKKRVFMRQFSLELEKIGLDSLGIVTIISFFMLYYLCLNFESYNIF